MDHFTRPIYSWYSQNLRHLPWRNTRDPYFIWISEAILQQTRVSQGLPYYLRITERFPDVRALAESLEDELLKLWEGLGYYTRARNLHQAARSILINYEGKFPETYESIRQLKGVGEYTAAAVASIAFGLPYATVDGNVIRVLSRYFGITEPFDSPDGRKIFRDLANEILDRSDPGSHNQSVMEFGALMCKPAKPECSICPVKSSCFACLNGVVEKLPVRKNKPAINQLYFTFLHVENCNSVLIGKRTDNGIWKSLYQLPLIETEKLLSEEEILILPPIANLLATEGSQLIAISRQYSHKLTHRNITARFVHIKCPVLSTYWSKYLQVDKEEISKFAFPVLIKNYLAEHEWI
jgi:A/G-specific adenine glycosylase